MEKMISCFMGKTMRPSITMDHNAINDKMDVKQKNIFTYLNFYIQFVPIIIYNSQSWAALDFVRIITETSKIEIFDSRLQKIDFNLIPRKDGKFDLYFIAESPAIGYDTYYSISKNESIIEMGIKESKESTINSMNSK